MFNNGWIMRALGTPTCFVLLFVMGAAANLTAAEKADDVPAAVQTVESDELEPVRSQLPTTTVIGSKEAVPELPGSGFYLDTQDIRRQGYDDINRVLRKVPGVYLREEEGFGLFPNISLRGVDHGRSAKVTLMEDGILQAPAPYSAPSAYYSPTAGRMHAIEVLKGSSQIRFGPHITGGVINYISTPIPDEKQGFLRSVFGTDNEFRTHAHFGETFNIKDGGRFGYVVEGYFRTTDGFKDFSPLTPDFNGGDTGFTNVEPMVKFMWEPAATEFYQRFEFKYGYTDRDADVTYLGQSESDFNDDPFDRYPATRFDEINTYQNRMYLKHLAAFSENFSIETTGYYNNFHRNWFKLHSVNGNNLSQALAGAGGGADLAVLKGDAAGSFNVRANNRDYYSWGVQVTPRYQFDWGQTEHEIELGVRLHNDRIRRFQWSVDFTQDAMGNITSSVRNPDGSAGNRRQETYALAVHLQDKISYGKWTFTPGVRVEHLEMDWTDFASDPTNTPTASDEGTLTLVGGGVGATYDWTEQFQLFGGIHRGFSPPGPRAHLRSGVQEETSIAFELGSRFQLPVHGFNAEVTGFYTQFDDLVAINNIGGVGSVDGSAENVGEVDTAGVELLMEYDPGVAYDWGFSMPNFISFTYTDAELASDTGGDPESIFSGGVKGNQVPYIPEYQITLGTGVEFERFGVFVTGNFTDEQFATASNTSAQAQPDGTPDARFGKLDSRFIVDVSAYYQFNDQVKIVGGAHNLFDEEYIATRLPHGPRAGKPQFLYAGVEIDF